MWLALHSKKKWGFVNGTILILENDSNKEEEQWKINILIKIHEFSMLADELWTNLKERFLVGNRPQKYELNTAFANCKQWRDLINVLVWLTFEKHMGWIKKFHSTPVYYRYALAAITNEREEEKTFQFLVGLISTIYSIVRFHHTLI